MDNRIKVDWNIISQCALLFSQTEALILQQKNKIVAEAIGTPFISRRQNKVLAKPFIITLFDSFYLFELYSILKLFLLEMLSKSKKMKKSSLESMTKDMIILYIMFISI